VPLAEGLAPMPPMGWSSWNAFQCNISSQLIRDTADAMVSSGMRDAGYEYVNIDDCWLTNTRSDGQPQFTQQFADGGIPAIAEYVHERGLKLGIYSDRGAFTCAGRVGSRGFETEDARLYASWGVDYLKYDNGDYLDVNNMAGGHNLNEGVMREQHGRMAAAVASSGRPIVFSLSAWAFYEWAVPFSNLWRTTGDITDSWASISGIINSSGNRLAAYAAPNHWNDPDMLQVGNGGLNLTESRAHFGMWAMMSAPLISGNDLRSMNQETTDLLVNREVIAIDQDPLGLQGVRVSQSGMTSVWAKPLGAFGARAVALLNQGEGQQNITFSLADVGLQNQAATLRDLWEGRDLGTTNANGQFSTMVPAHGMLLLRVVGVEPDLPGAGQIDVSRLDPIYAANALGPFERNRSVGGAAGGDGQPIAIRGATFDTGLGVAAGSLIVYRLGSRCTRFQAVAGIDDQANGSATVAFEVWGDNQKLFQSDIVNRNSAALPIDVDVTGVFRLKLKVTNGLDDANQDFASWGDARLVCAAAG